MNKEKNNTSSANKPKTAFVILFGIIACINLISMACDTEIFAETGSCRIVIMSVLAVVSIIVTLAAFALYFLKIFRIKSLKVRYFVVSLCSLIICAVVVFRGFPYMQDLKEGTSVVVTNDYWYYMGNEYIEFTDLSGNKQSVRASNIGEMTIPLIWEQFFSGNQSAPSDDSENNKKSIYIEYYPHSRTVVDMHMIK